jgi:hypothetical protein
MEKDRLKRTLAIVAVLIAVGLGGGLWLWGRSGENPTAVTAPEGPKPLAVTEKPPAPAAKAIERPQEAALARFSPEDGRILAYAFTERSDSLIDFGFIAAQGMPAGGAAAPAVDTIQLESSGTLFLKFYRQGPDTWRVGARIEGLSLLVNGTTPVYAEGVALPFTFTFDSHGYMSGFRFVAGLSGQAKDAVQHILGTLQTGLPESPKSEWFTRETDASGLYRARYRVDARQSNDKTLSLVKEKLEYLSTRTPDTDSSWSFFAYDKQIETAWSDIRVPRNGPWIEELDYRERSVLAAKGRSFAEGSLSFASRSVQKEPGTPFPDRYSGFLALMESDPYLTMRYYVTDSELDRLASGLDMHQTLDEFFRLRESDAPNADRVAEKFLVNYLRLHPDACLELVGLMDADPKRERFAESDQLLLWRLVTEAGHSEAQRALAEAAVNPAYSMLTHRRAIAYIHDFEYPQPFLVEKLWELYRKTPLESADPDQRQLRTMALFAIGSLGHDEKLNDTLKPQIGEQLTAYLRTTETPERRIAALSAIGNYGGSDALDAVEPYLSDGDENVRSAACKALRRMTTPMAAEALMEVYAGEASPDVKETVVRTISTLPITPRSRAWAARQIVSTDNPNEQAQLVDMLGNSMNVFPENENSLRALLAKNPHTRVKQDIYKYIAPGQ